MEKTTEESFFDIPRLVFFKNLLEESCEDVNLGILLNDNRVICLECGSEFEPEDYKLISIIPFDGVLDFKYITSSVEPKESDSINIKKKKLMIMDATMSQQVQDEDLYDEWIRYGVPNCPSDSDLESIANDNKLYRECFNLFCKILKKSKYSE